jgi:hypothetical protein
MNTLTIADLCVTEELDRRAMTAVSGGTPDGLRPLYPTVHVIDIGSFSAQQVIGQSSNIVNSMGNNASDSHSTVIPSQSAHNTITF